MTLAPGALPTPAGREDHRSQAAREALALALEALPARPRAVALGGGPDRADPRIRNLNIASADNVDLVADAHRLPFGDGTLDLVFSCATLEHLEDPDRALAEAARVLRPGGHCLTYVPFLQAYHPYPDHFRNFTLPGHRALHARAGLEVLRDGVCNGPVCAVLDVARLMVGRATPRFLRPLVEPGLAWTHALLLPLDRLVNDRPGSHVLASTTFVLSRRPA